jgi:hypothetical protein
MVAVFWTSGSRLSVIVAFFFIPLTDLKLVSLHSWREGIISQNAESGETKFAVQFPGNISTYVYMLIYGILNLTCLYLI